MANIEVGGKAQIGSEDVPADENTIMIRRMLDQAGIVGRGPGMECIGYAVVFYYRSKYSGHGEFRAHSEVKMLSEKSAHDGFKTLGIHLMKKFGRTPKLGG